MSNFTHLNDNNNQGDGGIGLWMIALASGKRNRVSWNAISISIFQSHSIEFNRRRRHIFFQNAISISVYCDT
jgi:hypothetical protein